MRFGRLLNLPIEILNALVQNLNHLQHHLHRRHLGLHYGAILQRRLGLPDGFDPALDQLLFATMLLEKEAPQGVPSRFLQCFERGPALQQSADQRSIHISKPVRNLRKVNFQVGF
jgi:hypothetical protein